jgi:cyclopropane-fatty-acyl-phospholipid synthase
MSQRRASPWERSLVSAAWRRSGSPAVAIRLWDGTECGAATSTSIGAICFHDPRLLIALWWNPSLAFGDGYTDGRITVEGDLPTVLTELMHAMARQERRVPWRPLLSERRFRRQGQSRSASSSNVAHHYDIGNDFYRLWLDRQLVYTCAYYERPDLTLEEAQVAKFDHICRKLRLRPGDAVVEAGCGWGGFALHMARQYGARVRAYNLSREQLAYARSRARAEGLDERVEFVDADYREITGKYDVFVSVGMLEHVGVSHYGELGEVIDRVLAPGGRGLIHTIGRNIARPLDPWIAQRIFPGAEPPSLRQMMGIFEPAGFSVLDVENLRLHYARTLREWLRRFEEHAGEVARMYDDSFVRMWRFYLAGSIAAFESGYLQLFQVQFARADDNSVPMVRHQYEAPQRLPAGPPAHEPHLSFREASTDGAPQTVQ